MIYEDIEMIEKEFSDSLSEDAENAIKVLQALGQLVYEAVEELLIIKSHIRMLKQMQGQI